MRKILWLFFTVLLVVRGTAQSNAPVRLAVIAEGGESSVVSDILTAELSKNPQVQLLERNEIDKVYREQGLSAANRDYIKLGQVLGADGLCLLDIAKSAAQTNLTLRIIAVRPGVVLQAENFPFPLTNITEWAEQIPAHLVPAILKMSVLIKDAIPISVVNIRSAVASAGSAEIDQQLKLLTIQRLSRESQFFVLERQRMQLLSDEKSLKDMDDSSFWRGSYLLEGAVDQNGFSKETMTIDARLIPAKGGKPLLFEVRGSRTNFSEVINQLAEKVSSLLKVNATAKEWSADEEAAQFFKEAKWALQWGVLPEAEAASDSAWTMGKRDLDCATIRVKAYLQDVPTGMGNFAEGSTMFDDPVFTEEAVLREMASLRKASTRVIFKLEGHTLHYVVLNSLPEPEHIDRALHTLRLYDDLSHALAGQLQPTGQTVSKNASAWFYLGEADLAAASKILQQYQFIPGSETPVADKLADLRSEARSVAKWISDNSLIRTNYFVGEGLINQFQLRNTIGNAGNIFRCESEWGCFWQESPEECLALYRDLLNSPAFCLIHDEFWIRAPQQPRLTAWNQKDRGRVPEVWDRFVQELEGSTNLLWRMEARALAFADAPTVAQKGLAFTNLFNLIEEHRDELAANYFELFYDRWGLDELFFHKGGTFYSLYSSNYRPELESIEKDYRQKTVPAFEQAAIFQQQKKYLESNKPYEFFEWQRIFAFRKFTKPQALALQPLVVVYESNLVAQSQVSQQEWHRLSSAMLAVFDLEDAVNRTLNPNLPINPAGKRLPSIPGHSVSTNIQAASTNVPRPPGGPSIAWMRTAWSNQQRTSHLAAANPPPAEVEPITVTNIIAVTKFVESPFGTMIAHHWCEGKLLIDCEIGTLPDMNPGKAYETPSALVVFDPVTEHWEKAFCPKIEVEFETRYYHRSALLHGELYHSDGGQIQKWNRTIGKWEVLPISDRSNYELFNVDEHLYAANETTVFEILDSGNSTRLMASNRRNPPVTLLDRRLLGKPVLSEGPNHSLRLSAQDRIFSWIGFDWTEEGVVPPASFPPQIFPEGLIYRESPMGPGKQDSLSYLATGAKSSELCFFQRQLAITAPGGSLPKPPTNDPAPRWRMPKELSLSSLSVASLKSGFVFLADHSEMKNTVNTNQEIIKHEALPKEGYHAALYWFSSRESAPRKFLLRFDSLEGCPPVTGLDSSQRQFAPKLPRVWMLLAGDSLIFGWEKSEGSPSDSLGTGYKDGIWILPLSKIEAAFSAQRLISN